MQTPSIYDEDYFLRRNGGALASYHEWMAGRRCERLREQAAVGPGVAVLEVGCDSARLLDRLRGLGAETHGIDVNADVVRAHNRPDITQGDAEHVPFADGRFDVCVASHVIEHLSAPRRFLAEMARVLRPGGKLALWYPFELFRGMTVLPELLFRGRRLSLAREYHLHRFRPEGLDALARGLPMRPVSWSWCVYGPVPEFLSIYERER